MFLSRFMLFVLLTSTIQVYSAGIEDAITPKEWAENTKTTS